MIPSITYEAESRIIARERLRLLSIGYYVSGGLGAFFASFLMIYVIMLGAFSFIPEKAWNSPSKFEASSSEENTLDSTTKRPAMEPRESPRSDVPPAIFFRIMAGFIFFIVLCGWALAGLTIYAGRCLAQRKARTFIYIMGGINMIWVPYGTLLGIATILVMNSDAAKSEFGLSGEQKNIIPPAL